jgi:hypothetical protein
MKRISQIFVLVVLITLLSACNLFAPTTQGQSAQPNAAGNSNVQNNAKPADANSLSLPAGMPTVETDFGKMLNVLQSGKFSYIASLAKEKYDANSYLAPGTLTFTVPIPSTETVYLNYGWCAKDKTTLQQNLQHIQLSFYFNDQQIPASYITSLNTQTSNKLECSNTGMLLSGWPAGVYRFRIVATFGEAINDGSADYKAGDYISEYNVTAQ